MTELAKPKVGQTVWFVPSDHRAKPIGREVKVTKVGRKYFECGAHLAFYLDTWREKSEICFTGRAYLTQAHHEYQVRRQRYWNALQRAIRMENRPAALVTVHNIRTVTELLGLKLEVDNAP